MKKANKTIVTILMTLAVVMLLPIVAKAATYSYNISGSKRDISCVNGQTTLVVDGKSFELTKQLVAADVALDANGTAWILFKNGAVYWWSYDIQGSSNEVKLIKFCSNAEELVIDSSSNYITGIKTSAGTISKILTLDEQKNVINSSTGSSNSGSTNAGSSDSGNTNAGSSDSGSTNTGGSDSGSTNTGGSDSGSTNTGGSNSGSTNAGGSDSGNTNSANTNSGQANATAGNNSSSTTTTTTTTTTTKETTTTVTSSISVSRNDGKATVVTPKGKYTYRLYSNKKLLTSYTLKNGVLKWRGWKMKNVVSAGFIKNSKNLAVITKSGKVYVFDYVTMKKSALIDTKKYGKAQCFNYDKKGFVRYVVTKKPLRINVTKK